MAASRSEALEARLTAFRDQGVIGDFSTAKAASNGELIWTIAPTAGEPIALKTPLAEAFADGLTIGAAAPRSTRKPRVKNAYRQAIADTGTITIEVAPDADVRIERNKLFLAAYAEGLKGAFKVSTERFTDKTGAVTGYVLTGSKA